MRKLLSSYSGKVVLVTGHTGFKGSWLSIWLRSLGAKVVGVSSDIPTKPSNFLCSDVSKIVDDYRLDIRDVKSLTKVIENTKPDFIFHLAAQALVRSSYESPLETFSINALGPISLLESIKNSKIIKPLKVVLITSDKAYKNVEWKWGYRETDQLGGKDPYSASKSMAELAIYSYIKSFFDLSSSNTNIAIARAGNVIGGGDWAENRIVPDCINAWSKNEMVDIRSPNATRPWQHVLEPLSGYLVLGHFLLNDTSLHGEAYNFGPDSNQNFSVKKLIIEMKKYWEKVRWTDISNKENNFHEAGLLKLNCDKALFDLNWKPTLDFTNTVRMTIEWYKYFYQKKENSMLNFTENQIKEYIHYAIQTENNWAKDD